MADTKLTALTEVSVPLLTDIGYWVADPAGTPASDKISGTRLGGLLTRAVALGRLTTQTGVPISTADRTAQGTIYWTPYNGNQIGIYDGTRWQFYTFTERSLALAGLIPNGVVSNVFIYDNAGTLTLELGHWQNATITVTIASPGVVTWTSHGLSNGDTVVFSNSGGALPTGITAGTPYYVLSAAANTFQIAGTSGGTVINTSGSQSGTHTGYVVGLGSASSAVVNTVMNLTTQDGIYVKSGATTRRWLGVIRASGTDVTADSGGGATTQVGGLRYVWNAYNQVRRTLAVIDTTDSWAYGTATWRSANNASANAVAYVTGQPSNVVEARALATVFYSANGTLIAVTVGVDNATPAGLWSGIFGTNGGGDVNHEGQTGGHYLGSPGLGYHVLNWIELGATGTSTFLGDNGGNVQSGLIAALWN